MTAAQQFSFSSRRIGTVLITHRLQVRANAQKPIFVLDDWLDLGSKIVKDSGKSCISLGNFMSDSPVLREISRWSIEAKDEDSSVYFFHFGDVSDIEDGRKNYVIGRKGTGKTAIAEYLHNQKSYNQFSRLLSFKNFPFNSLYGHADDAYNRPNQYITLWIYVIYHYICSMLAENELVRSRCGFDLRKSFDFDVQGALARSVKTITSQSYSLNLAGFGGGFQSDGESAEFDYVKANEAMREFIHSVIDDSEYYVIFDELDEDYRDVLNPDRKDSYFELLISLFKAVQVIRAEFANTDINIRPIIFLRDDIFDLCRDVDKNKWLDRAVTLKWDESQLRELVQFRLSRAIQTTTGETVDVSSAWDEVFGVRKTSIGSSRRGSIDTFKFLTSRTFLRPRDIISHVRECAKVALSRGNEKINNIDIKDSGSGHSAYMRREVIDELFPVLDDVAEILGVLSRIRKPIFTRKEFNDRYREYLNQNSSSNKTLTESQVLKLLFHFNVIGNITTGNHRVFAYDSDVKVMNMDENICVHNGLIHSLDIL
ncbi:hypothetical protein KBY27_21935 [Ruegeria pomeroyi]|uniref:ATPase n=1 Tax=Ruegeria pomeroyi TaxID=89184 RepID=A0A9Q3WSC0_9RHOB|nr:hypothetical protein [Ruegeria pomeroyi]MCE8540132.1 hypothetical protein [Ruegeria pomeroyi]